MNPRNVGKPRPDGLVAEFHPGNGLGSSRRGRCGDYQGANHGTQYGTPALVFVSATNDYVSTDNAAITQFPFTVCGWCKTTDASVATMFWCGDKDVEADYIQILGDSNTIYVSFVDGGFNHSIFAVPAYDDGNWHSYVATAYVDGSDVKIKLWVDGVLIDTKTSTAATTYWSDIAPDRTAIGRLMDSSPAYTIQGTLKNWLCYDGHQADDTDALRFHNGYDLQQTPSLIWRCNESSGAVVVDYSGNGYAGTISGATWDFGANGGNSHWSNADALNMGGDATDADTTLTVDDGTKFTAGDNVGVNGTGEIFTVGAVSTNDLTGCTRGALGTTAAVITDDTILRIVGDQQTADGLYFDGVNDRVQYPTSLLEIGTADFTVNLWAYSDNWTNVGSGPLFAKGIANGDIVIFKVTGGGTIIAYTAGGDVDAKVGLTGAGCQMITLVRSSGNWELFANGVGSGSPGAAVRDISSSSPVTIGDYHSGADPQNFTAKTLQIFYRALSDLEITALYNRGANG